jgi:hypothetical protein
MRVLRDWAGRDVVVVPILEPGISLAPYAGALSVDGDGGVVRVRAAEDGQPIALRRSTFIAADWIAGQVERGLSIVQGGVRVDVFLDPARGRPPPTVR